MIVYAATKNDGKLRELRAIFATFGWQVITFPAYRDVLEGEASYVANAALKARALRQQLLAEGIVAAVLGDDSGLEVAALGGVPGVLSARYGGPTISWPERRRLLLAEVAKKLPANRAARFVCALYFISVGGESTHVFEEFCGVLAREERGKGGFSYDPIFESPAHGRTFAELDEREKNRISHRARAAAALVATLAGKPGSAHASGK